MIASLVKANKGNQASRRASDSGRARWRDDTHHRPAADVVSRLMKEYQAVILRLTRHSRDDEDAITDLLNERSRGGWELAMLDQAGLRLTIVFQRPTDSER
jgi:hypothetical protein